jgi:dGTPase
VLDELIKNDVPSGQSSGFRHNEQSVRVADVIVRDGAGLNLTAEVRDGILNHSSGSKAITLEGDVVRLSDKIAYINHDIEDAIHSGVLKPDELPANTIRILGDDKSKRITSLIMSIINTSDNVIRYDDETKSAHDELREFMFRQVYNSLKINEEKEKAIFVVEFLYSYYKKNLHKMPTLYQKLAQSCGEQRAVCDYISGMTDDFAVYKFTELCVPKAWKR